MITIEKFKEAAAKLNVEVAALRAIADVESGGKGFLQSGEPVILFEPHVFWQRLLAKGRNPSKILLANPSLSDILYPKWGTKPYGKTTEQHSRLQRASLIDRDAALESASWGEFQVLGRNWRVLGYNSLQEFINAAYKSEDEHLEMLVRYIIVNNLAKYIRNHDWAAFALRYNGKAYKANKYDTKIAAAYNEYKNK